jgi:outer membrane receptor protein involved in Fe transport
MWNEEKGGGENQMKKRIGFSVFLMMMFSLIPLPAVADNSTEKERVHQLEEVTVRAKTGAEAFTYKPESTTIDLDGYEPIDIPQNVGDILKDLIIFDFRGESALVPDDDTFQMRSFEANRFVTAIDGLNLRKTGGRKSSHIVDYAYLPTFLIERIEVLPGPHSALYPAKSIGGVVNFITRAPRVHEELKPNIHISTSYKSYDTQNHNLHVQGSLQSFTYDLGYQKYATDGYLRNNDADIDTVFGRFGYVLPSGGHVAVSGSYSDADRGIVVFNDPTDPQSNYDNDYPKVSDALFYNWQKPTWNGRGYSYRLNYRQPTTIGNLSGDAYYSEEVRNRSYLSLINPADPSLGFNRLSSDTNWYQEGAKIQNEFRPANNHLTTLIGDFEQCYDGEDKDRRIRIRGGGIQHQWRIVPRLTLTGGLRYEDVNIWVSNSGITGRPPWIERKWNEWLPKSFLTYELDDLASVLRDTSVSIGVSRIWRAPDYHGDYNPQGRSAGAWLDPEHGVGMDAVLTRRLWHDVNMKVAYSHYSIKDYIASNSAYAQFTPSPRNPVPPGMEFMDYKINLEEVVRQGVELEFTGHLMRDLSFYLGYAYSDLESKGDEPAGVREASNRSKHRINAGLRYDLFENTTLLLDYKFQDEQVSEIAEELAPDEWIIRQVAIDSFHIVDFGIRQTLFHEWGPLRNGVLRLFINNVFDETYTDSSGYPATDRTFGIGFSFKM